MSEAARKRPDLRGWVVPGVLLLLWWLATAQRLVGPTFHALKQIALFAWIPLLSAWFGFGAPAIFTGLHLGLIYAWPRSAPNTSFPPRRGSATP